MRITLKQTEIQKALVDFVAGMGVGGDAVQTAQVLFTKGRKGNGLTAEIVIGESVEEVAAEADEADAADEAQETQEAVAETAETADTAVPDNADPFLN